MYFSAPDLAPGDYRIRRNLVLDDDGARPVQERTPTLHTSPLILAPTSAGAGA